MGDFAKLNNEQVLFYEKICETLKSKGERVRAPRELEKQQFIDSIEAVEYSHPELFYVDFRSIHYTDYSDCYEYNPRYLYTFSVISQRESAVREEAERIISVVGIKDGMSIYEKCGRLHNYIVTNCVYDNAAKGNSDSMWEAYTIEGCLLKKKAVCRGIALSFSYLCDLVGVKAIVAQGVSLEPGCTTYERHAWNIVMAKNEAAHIDVTWDMCLTGNSGRYRYDYFFLPDLEMMRDHQYVGYPICRQLKSTYYEKTGTQFNCIDVMARYIKDSIKRWESNSEDAKSIYLHFKMKNLRQTKEEITKYINDLIRETMKKGYSYIVSINDTQSVFSYSIEYTE